MRVAVHIPPEHPEHGGGVDGHAVVAYKLGRIEEGVHNAPIGHPEIPLEEFVANLINEARVDYPDYTLPDARVVRCIIRVERMIDNGDGTSSWIAADEFNPEVHTPQGAGNIQTGEFHVTSDQSTGGEA